MVADQRELQRIAAQIRRLRHERDEEGLIRVRDRLIRQHNGPHRGPFWEYIHQFDTLFAERGRNGVMRRYSVAVGLLEDALRELKPQGVYR